MLKIQPKVKICFSLIQILFFLKEFIYTMLKSWRFRNSKRWWIRKYLIKTLSSDCFCWEKNLIFKTWNLNLVWISDERHSFCLHKEGHLDLIKIVSRTFRWKSEYDARYWLSMSNLEIVDMDVMEWLCKFSSLCLCKQ